VPNFATLTPEERRKISILGAKALRLKGLSHQFTQEEAKEAGRKGGLATWKRWKISRRGKELKCPGS
jgi:general stress protein YciG